MILIDFHELQIDCLSGFPTSFLAAHSLFLSLSVSKLWPAWGWHSRHHAKWRDAARVHNGHSKCGGHQEALRGTLSLFPPNPGPHTLTGPCVWVWCHPASGALFFFFVAKCAPFAQPVSRVTCHTEEGGCVNTSKKCAKGILGTAQ